MQTVNAFEMAITVVLRKQLPAVFFSAAQHCSEPTHCSYTRFQTGAIRLPLTRRWQNRLNMQYFGTEQNTDILKSRI